MKQNINNIFRIFNVEKVDHSDLDYIYELIFSKLDKKDMAIVPPRHVQRKGVQ